jgi:Flp pilus assembly protein TadG
MTRPLIRHFVSTRRSAIAVTMAIALVPLILLIGIAVDITFLSQARTQTAFASQAAAASATRIAAATYALEISQGATATNAATLAVNAANEAGNDWFTADLGNYVRGTLASGPTTTTKYNGVTSGQGTTAGPPDFTASITSATSYPPIFDPIFGSTKNWVYSSGATATTNFSYAQILMMLDTSNSMLIGADPSDIATMEGNSVCPKFGYLSIAAGMTDMHNLQTWYGWQSADSDQILFNSATAVPNYVDPSGGVSDQSGHCASGYGTGSAVGNSVTSGTASLNSCALACHSTSATYTDTNPPAGFKSGTFYSDLYGMARREGVTLRLDVVLSATENVISDMESSEPTQGQLSVGVYQFNSDVLPIVTGINAGQSGGDTLPEATSNLTTALTEVQNVDYNHNPNEKAIPALVNETSTLNMTSSPPTAALVGNTNFVKSLNDLVAGNATGGSSDALTASGDGSTAAKPQKFIFIVTDGMQDSAPANGGGENGIRVIGDMTNIAAENAAAKAQAATTNAVCSTLKYTLGYTVYVLYVAYYPLATNIAYYNYLEKPDAATSSDFPSDSYTTPQILTEVPSESAVNNQKFKDSPGGQALQACASSPTDFYAASSSSDIQTALTSMLKSALASTIRLTN